MPYVSFVVATKDRPGELRRLLESLRDQGEPSGQIAVVDASAQPVLEVCEGFPDLNVNYLRAEVASAARQRNQGVPHVDPRASFIGFLDDDAVLAEGALDAMMRFWQNAPPDVAGASFNLANAGPMEAAGLKDMRITERLGLYGRTEGSVAPSGFHRRLGTVGQTIIVEWLPTTACIWRAHILREHQFDPWFEGCSYVEDLDFSYGISRHYRLAVVADARFYHLPSPSGRPHGFEFGKTEVRNRLYFVRKHGLSVSRCYLGLAIRLLMNIECALRRRESYFFQRAMGNVYELMRRVAAGPKRTRTFRHEVSAQ